MKIAHLLHHVGVGGAEKYIENLHFALKTHGHELMLIYDQDGGGLKHFTSSGMKVFRVPMRSVRDVSAWKKIKQLVSEEKATLVHTHFMRENAIAVGAGLIGMKTPIVYTRHMLTQISSAAALFNRILFTRNKRIIAVSTSVKRQLTDQGAPDKKIVVIPPILSDVSKEEAAVSKESAERWMISIGRLSPEKGHMFLLQAIKVLFEDEDLNSWKLLIIGSGEEERRIRRFIQENGLEDRILLKGYIKDPYRYLRASDIYINHSEEEAFGLTIAEAVQCGVPVVMADNSGARDYFNRENDGALLYRYGEVTELVVALKQLIQGEELRKTLSGNATRILHEELKQEKIVSEILRIYETDHRFL